jgi:hypothetical protein
MGVFFFGLGFSSRAAARAIRADHPPHFPVFGTARSADRAQALSLEGLGVHVFDGSAPCETLRGPLADTAKVILSIPPNQHGDPVLRHHGADLMRSEALDWLCYYSTVGVYGDHAGGWIDETAAPHPLNARSQWRLETERNWQGFADKKGVPLCILRLAGIYGPGRSSLDKLRAGAARRIVKPGQVFNRIHVADIARVTAAAARQKLSGTFNLADDEPAPPQNLVSFAAHLMGVEPPPEQAFETAQMTEMARSFYADNKRVSNAAIKKALGIELKYPTYRQGLTAIFEGIDR